MIDFKPWLWLDAQRAHDWAPFFVNAWAKHVPSRELTWRPFEWRGLRFKNRLGVAGGVDKDGLAFHAWTHLGAGFVEVGTVTPEPQGPNPGPTVARDLERSALWNKLGFPSRGSVFVREKIRDRPRGTPLFVNIGKNRATPLEQAAQDYARLIRDFSGVADGFVVNISSPNTQDLRNLQGPSHLDGLLREVIAARTDRTPVLLKLSPDLTREELAEVLEVSFTRGIDGWILTNTTRERPEGIAFPKEGGLSGAPLGKQSKMMLQSAVEILGPRRTGRLLVSVGGVMSPEDVAERLDLGADLVQVYSALIFSGPGFFSRVARVLGNRE